MNACVAAMKASAARSVRMLSLSDLIRKKRAISCRSVSSKIGLRPAADATYSSNDPHSFGAQLLEGTLGGMSRQPADERYAERLMFSIARLFSAGTATM